MQALTPYRLIAHTEPPAEKLAEKLNELAALGYRFVGVVPAHVDCVYPYLIMELDPDVEPRYELSEAAKELFGVNAKQNE